MGLQIGAVIQRVPGFHKFLRLFQKGPAAFSSGIERCGRQSVSEHSQRVDFLLLLLQLKMDREKLGYIKQKFRFLKPRFRIFDVNNF